MCGLYLIIQKGRGKEPNNCQIHWHYRYFRIRFMWWVNKPNIAQNLQSVPESETLNFVDFLCMLLYILFFGKVIVALDTGKLGMIFTFCCFSISWARWQVNWMGAVHVSTSSLPVWQNNDDDNYASYNFSCIFRSICKLKWIHWQLFHVRLTLLSDVSWLGITGSCPVTNQLCFPARCPSPGYSSINNTDQIRMSDHFRQTFKKLMENISLLLFQQV